MVDNWTQQSLGDFAPFVYGKGLPKKKRNASGSVPVYGSNGIVDKHDTPLVLEEGIIVGRKGTIGSVHYSNVPFWPIDTTFYIQPASHRDTRFTYYLLKTLYLEQMNSDSAVPGLNRTAAHARRVKIPPLDEQRAIAFLLGSLDDKIELNRRMNETLEAMARALFKSWLVDFDPVVAKAEGRKPYGMNDVIASSFPDAFEDSALGKIPKGWSVESVYSVAGVIYGAPFSSKLFNEEGDGLPILRIRDLATHNPKVYTSEGHPKGTKVLAGDIVVGMDGEFRAHIWTGPDSWLNQRVCMFVPKKGVSAYFVKESLREPLAFFERAKIGTTVIHLGKGDIDTFQVIVPNQGVMEAFQNLIEPTTQRVISNVRESRILGAIRDTLLPKLLSGEIRIPDAEKRIEEAV